MKKIMTLLLSITLILSMTCVSFGDTDMQRGSSVENPVLIDDNAIVADADKEITIDLLQNGGTQTIIPMFQGTLRMSANSAKIAPIVAYTGYYKLHSWKGSRLTFGLGITSTSSILTRYQTHVEIWDANLINHKKMDGDDIDIMGIGGTVSLVDDVNMYTGSLKSVELRVTNIRVQTTAGPISRPKIGTVIKRP